MHTFPSFGGVPAGRGGFSSRRDLASKTRPGVECFHVISTKVTRELCSNRRSKSH
jgi:hypothetical protein